MLLAVDIGNTTIALGLLDKDKALKTWRIETALRPQKLEAKLRRIFLTTQNRAETVVICSVVPRVLSSVVAIARKSTGKNPLVIGRHLSVPIRNRYRNPRQVGQDRLVCAYAAMKRYGKPVIVVDLGTAITLDAVSKKGEYLGGIIVPGIRLSAESLFKKTALLPKIRIGTPREVIGRDTKGSILSGLFYGYGALCSGLIGLISKKIGPGCKIVITGGHAALMKKFISKKITSIDANLVFYGIYLVYKTLNRKNNAKHTS